MGETSPAAREGRMVQQPDYGSPRGSDKGWPRGGKWPETGTPPAASIIGGNRETASTPPTLFSARKESTMRLATHRGLNRRQIMAGAAAAAGVALTGRLPAAESAVPPARAVKTYANADFYDAAGKFLAEKAKEAYFDMFRRFDYPSPTR